MSPKGKKETATGPKVAAVTQVLEVIETKVEDYVESLKDFAGIYCSSMVGNSNGDGSVNMALKMAVDSLRNVGAQVEEFTCSHGTDDWDSGGVPTVIGLVEGAADAGTVLVYCLLDGAATRRAPSYVGTTSKYVRGPGVHDAASFLIWINTILAHKEAKISLPYNIKFVVDGSSRRRAARATVALAERADFVGDATICVACTSQAVNSAVPDIVYGFRGICDFFVVITQQTRNGETRQDKTDVYLEMLHLMNSLVDSDGNITVDGFAEDVGPVTQDQRIWLTTVDFDKRRLSSQYSANDSSSQTKAEHLEKIWCRPAIVLKGIEEIKAEDYGLIGKFSVLTVPNHNPTTVRKLILGHLAKKWKETGSSNKLEMGMDYWSWAWRGDVKDDACTRLAESISVLHGRYPQYILSGSHLAFPAIFRRLADKNVLIFTLGSHYDFHMTQDERLLVKDYINGVKLATRFLHYTKEEPQTPQSKTKKK